jgi:ATP synthase, subunit C
MANNFYALNAKIGVLKKGILKKEDYDKILSFSKREEFLDFISNNPIYKKLIEKNRDKAIEHRYAHEFMLRKTEVEILRKLRHFLSGQDKYIVDSMLVRYEFEDIKIILRSIVEKEKIDLEEETLLYNYENHVDYEKLLACESINQAIDMLKNTSFKRAFVGLVDEELQRLHFHVEMNLDALYFAQLRKTYMRLSRVNKEILENYYTSLTDTINIQWIIRAKKYYNLSNEEIYNYTLRYGKYIKGDFLKSLVYSESVDEIIEKIKSTKLSSIFEDFEKQVVTYRNIQNYTYAKQFKYLKNYQNNISMCLKLIIQLLIQNENFIRIGESQKYKLSSQEINRYLIFTS